MTAHFPEEERVSLKHNYGSSQFTESLRNNCHSYFVEKLDAFLLAPYQAYTWCWVSCKALVQASTLKLDDVEGLFQTKRFYDSNYRVGTSYIHVTCEHLLKHYLL